MLPRLNRRALALSGAALFALSAPSFADPVLPVYADDPSSGSCTDIESGKVGYRSSDGVVSLSEGFGTFGDRESCHEVKYTFTVALADGTVVGSIRRHGADVFPEVFTVTVPRNADGTLPGVCITATTEYKNRLIDTAPDVGCAQLNPDQPPGLAWH